MQTIETTKIIGILSFRRISFHLPERTDRPWAQDSNATGNMISLSSYWSENLNILTRTQTGEKKCVAQFEEVRKSLISMKG